MKKIFILLILPLAFFPIHNFKAQEIDGSFSLIVSPATPRPGQVVEIYLEAPGVDLDTSNITWTINGLNGKRGKGEKYLTLTAGQVGQLTTVKAAVNSSIGTFTRNVVINPAEIDILWQGNTYIPLSYKGRPLWTHQSQITLVAIPHVIISNNIESSPASLIYKWTKNGTVLGNISGVGRNSLTFADSILSKPQTIKVEVLTDKNTVVASQIIEVTPTNPTIAVYEDSPLYGLLFNREIDSLYSLTNREVTFAAIPLFFNVVNRNDIHLSYSWVSDNGIKENNNSVTYRAPDGASGISKINVGIKNNEEILQSVKKNLLVRFGKTNER